jgi:hypothetical protein
MKGVHQAILAPDALLDYHLDKKKEADQRNTLETISNRSTRKKRTNLSFELIFRLFLHRKGVWCTGVDTLLSAHRIFCIMKEHSSVSSLSSTE